jgi:hypothetical protein
MEDYNTVRPYSRLGYRSPGEYIMLSQSAAPTGSLPTLVNEASEHGL